jgi:hypothetical protein
LWVEQLHHFAGQPERAAELLSVGQRKAAAGVLPAEAAAATVLAQALLAYDECVVRR